MTEETVEVPRYEMKNIYQIMEGSLSYYGGLLNRIETEITEEELECLEKDKPYLGPESETRRKRDL